MGTRSILIFDNKPDGWITIEFAANNLLIRVQSLQLKRSSALQPNLHVCSSLYRQCHSRSKQFDLARDLSRGEPGFRWSAPLHNAGSIQKVLRRLALKKIKLQALKLRAHGLRRFLAGLPAPKYAENFQRLVKKLFSKTLDF